MASNPPPKSFLPFEDFNQGLTAENLPKFKEFVMGVLKSPSLIYDQQRASLAAAAARVFPYPTVSEEAQSLIQKEIIDLIGENGAPFHPRYVAPDYAKLLRVGSAFLELKPAHDLQEATTSLLTAYQYMPNAQLPVFIGHLDELLEPYLEGMTDAAARSVLKSFWTLVDRLNPSGFVHANIGPRPSRVGRLLLDIDREVRTITNLTLRYDPELTPDEFALEAVRNQLLLSKPYFVNHRLMLRDWGSDYCVASCLNGMPLRGGVMCTGDRISQAPAIYSLGTHVLVCWSCIHTLVRLNLKAMVEQLSDGTVDDVLDRVIPATVERLVEIVNSRVRFLVEEVGWYRTNYWVREGLLDPARFTSYAGLFGLNEAVAFLTSKLPHGPAGPARFGRDPQANRLALRLVERLHQEIDRWPAVHSGAWHDRVVLHAQVGINSDLAVTPGCRVPRGQEPADVCEHIGAEAPLHSHIAGGCSTIVDLEQTAAQNPAAVLDIAKGAMASGTRTLSIGTAGTEFVRVTGYLVRRSDMDKWAQTQATRHSTAALGAEFFAHHPESLHHRAQIE
ncbi:putative YjjI family glycine radical enzyme [Paratrimastix pyriformis]|uniref:YjjI family glycine radical enzyme n=1 Tax=Paratrimastix pyriformis TaxID=342808 RepID=A0ABQ8UL40_9EUKA|nr:putative YjjI family glycine radical enzyme [Paratrimastix pyriformis]